MSNDVKKLNNLEVENVSGGIATARGPKRDELNIWYTEAEGSARSGAPDKNKIETMKSKKKP